MKLTLTALVCVVLAQTTWDAKQPPGAVRAAYDTLLTTKYLSLGPVGERGVASPAEKAYRIILHDPAATRHFKRLINTATPEGQLYALAGLHSLDQEAYRSIAPRYAESETEIQLIYGCWIDHLKTSQVFRRIDAR